MVLFAMTYHEMLHRNNKIAQPSYGALLHTYKHWFTERETFGWLDLRTHHLWRTIKEVGLLFSEDHLPQSMSQPVQLLNQAIHLHPNTSHYAHYTIGEMRKRPRLCRVNANVSNGSPLVKVLADMGM